MADHNHKFPPRQAHEPTNALELIKRYRPDIDVIRFCAQEVKDHLLERDGIQMGEMGSMELNQLRGMKPNFLKKLPSIGTPIVVGSDFHIDNQQYQESDDEVAIPISGLLRGEYMGIDINEYQFKKAHRFFGLVVSSCVEFQNGPRTFTTPVLGSTIYFFNNN